MFEKYKVAGLFFAKDATLSAYACGKTTGLVVDCGASSTLLSPVIDGWVEPKGMLRCNIGGTLMDAYLTNLLHRRLGRKLIPAYRLLKNIAGPERNFDVLSIAENKNLGGVHPSFDSLMQLELAREMKQVCCKTAFSNLKENESVFYSLPLSQYELPDGTVLDLGMERFQVPELYFDTSHVSTGFESQELANLYSSGDSAAVVPGYADPLPKMISDSIIRCDGENQTTLLANIILTGGASAFDGFQDRLKLEVERIVHATVPSLRVRVFGNSLAERPVCAWLGGSIVASLGSFHEIWVSRKEYEEFGAGIVDKKCP